MAGKFSGALQREINSYESTEWTGTIGGTDATLCARPLSTHDLTIIMRRFPNFMNDHHPEGMIDLIILKTTDRDGEKAFTKEDKPLLMRLGSEKTSDIFGTLFAAQLEKDDEEARAKN